MRPLKKQKKLKFAWWLSSNLRSLLLPWLSPDEQGWLSLVCSTFLRFFRQPISRWSCYTLARILWFNLSDQDYQAALIAQGSLTAIQNYPYREELSDHLWLAVRFGRFDVLQFFHEEIDFDLLVCAVEFKQVEILKAFVAMEKCDADDRKILVLATVRHNSLACFQLMIKWGWLLGDLEVMTIFIVKFGRLNFLRFLYDHNQLDINYQSWLELAKNGHSDLWLQFQEWGIPPPSPRCLWFHALQGAITKNNVDFLIFLKNQLPEPRFPRDFFLQLSHFFSRYNALSVLTWLKPYFAFTPRIYFPNNKFYF